MHGSDRIFRNISFFSSLALYHYRIIAFVVVLVLARILIVINNDAKTLTDGLGWLEPAIAGHERLIGDFRAACKGATLGVLTEPTEKFGRLPRIGGELELERDVFSLEVQGRYLVNIDTQVLVLDFTGLVPAILKVVEGLGHWCL